MAKVPLPSYFRPVVPFSTLLNGLISYWKCDDNVGAGTVLDSVGGHNGTPSGCIQGAAGKIDKCLQLDTSGGVSMGYVEDLSPVHISIAAWVYNTETNGVIVSNWEYSPAYLGYNLWVIGWVPYFGIDGAVSGGSVTGGTDIGDSWHLVVATYDGVHIKLYVDGESDAEEVDFTQDIAYEASCPFLIGRAVTGSGQPDFATYIDEVAIWNRALTTDEITELWNSGDGNTWPFT